ncbi:tol-pal system protein YbgF [Shewanella waksmanii]|uniref:tol-pal system protein YbgF n=1 Tax=Shewanella waksmanii TaxID=213783 RepID=UPI00048F99AC|nr:tol-pal system protein YbgF [Shewanella waksmanii]
MKKAVLTAVMIFCSGSVFAAPAPVEDIAGGSYDDRVERLERMLKARQQVDFQTQQRLDTLQQEVLDLRGLNEQQAYQIEQMLQRQRQLYDEIANLSSNQGSSAVAAVTSTTTTSQAATSSSLGETASYEQAVNLVLKERKYDEAIPAFSNFIKSYPDSTYAANANYWLGQLLYNKGDFSEATTAFSTVVDQYKDSNKRGDSLVKLGMIAEKTADVPGAKGFYQRVVKEYPASAAARIAKQQLAAL